jgi:long-chain fatty acid transport protein
MTSHLRCGRAIILLFLTSAALTSAHASGPAFTRLFAEAETAQTSILAPAAMTRLDERQVAVQAIIAQSFGEFKVDESVTTVSGGDPRSSDPVAVPALYYVQPFAEDWRLGMSLVVPAGFGSSNGPNWAGRYYSDKFDMIFVAANVTLAHPVTSWLSLGGGVSIMGSSVGSTTQVNNLGPDNPDAKLETDADGVGFGLIASAMIEFSPKTRFTATWNSETEPSDDVTVKLKRSTLPPALVDDINQQGKNIQATIRVPQHVELGLFHEFENGWSTTLDAIWVDYSRFGLTQLNVDGVDLNEADMNFNNFWVVTAGLGFPLTHNIEGRVGALYMQDPVDNADRTFSFDQDTVYGAGVGIHHTLNEKHSYDLNLSVFNFGDGPIDTGELSALTPSGRVAGETDSPYSVILTFSWFWK